MRDGSWGQCSSFSDFFSGELFQCELALVSIRVSTENRLMWGLGELSRL